MKTKIIGTITNRLEVEETDEIQLQITVSDYHYIAYAKKLEKNKEIAITFDEVKTIRTQKQNAYLWELIQEICRNENAQSQDKWDMYCYLVRYAGIKSTVLLVPEEAVETLKRAFRVVRVREYRQGKKGTRNLVCECYTGTSQFNRKEMGMFIDKTLEYAEQIGIDTYYFKELLHG